MEQGVRLFRTQRPLRTRDVVGREVCVGPLSHRLPFVMRGYRLLPKCGTETPANHLSGFILLFVDENDLMLLQPFLQPCTQPGVSVIFVRFPCTFLYLLAVPFSPPRSRPPPPLRPSSFSPHPALSRWSNADAEIPPPHFCPECRTINGFLF